MASKDLKITFSGDSKSYRQEVDKASVATNKFSKDAGSAMNDLAGVFGINIGAISSSMTNMSKSFKLLHTSMVASAAGASTFKAAMNVVKIAAISTGIGALIIAIGSLVSYFTATERGAESVERAMASLKAVFGVLRDRTSALGETIVNAFKNPKETVVELWRFIESQFVNRIKAIPLLIESAWKIVKGVFNGGLGNAAKDFASATAQLATGFDKTQQGNVLSYLKSVGKEFVNEGSAAYDLKRRLQELEDAEKQLALVNTDRRANARELFAQSNEYGISAEKKVKLIKDAMALEKLAFDEEQVLAREALAIHKEQVALGEARDEQNYKTLELQGVVNNLRREAANTEISYGKALKGATAELNAENEATARALALGPKPVAMEAKTSVLVNTKYQTENPTLKDNSYFLQAELIKAKNEEIAASSIDMSETVRGALTDMTVGFGEYLGSLIAGQGDIGDFANFISGSFAELAVTVGKQMIAFGFAGVALNKLMLSPGASIAAGIALVALGSAAKKAIASSISGGGASSSASSGGNYNFDSRQSIGASKMQTVNVVVSGELKASGGALSTVLSQENQRKVIVT